MWVFDEDMGMNCRDITYVPGLYKIFDEILGEVLCFCFFGDLVKVTSLLLAVLIMDYKND